MYIYIYILSILSIYKTKIPSESIKNEKNE